MGHLQWERNITSIIVSLPLGNEFRAMHISSEKNFNKWEKANVHSYLIAT